MPEAPVKTEKRPEVPRLDSFARAEAVVAEVAVAYGIGDQDRGLLDQVWSGHRQLLADFKALLAEARRSGGFHFGNEETDHTALVVALLGEAVVGAATIRRLPPWRLEQEQVVALLAAAMVHDWGYLQYQNGLLLIRPREEGGHEHWSGIMFKERYGRSFAPRTVALVEECVEWTRLTETIPPGTDWTQTPGLLLRTADVTAGFWSTTPEEYRQKMVALLAENGGNPGYPFSDLEALLASRTTKDTIFAQEQLGVSQPFFDLLDHYYAQRGEAVNPVRQALAENMATFVEHWGPIAARKARRS